MALGMKQWLGLVGVGFFLVALRTLPPAALEVSTRQDAPLQAERRLNALRRDIVYTNERLQRTRWAEAVIPAALSGEGPVVFGFPDNAVPEQVERVRNRTAADLDETNALGDVALGLFFLDFRNEQYSGAPTAYNLGPHYFFGKRDGRPYCAAVRPVWRQTRQGEVQLSTVGRDGSYLGVCALIREYGLPGPAVHAWLAGGGAALAATNRRGGGTVMYFRDVRNAAIARRGLLGQKSGQMAYLLTRLDYDRCFAGVVEGCAQLFLHPEADSYRGPGFIPEARTHSFTPAQAVQGNSTFEPADYHAVADLAQEFGRERFLAWWTADGDVADAFRNSFGVDVGAWNLTRISHFVTIARPGPAVSQTGVMSAVLLLAVSGIIAGLWARRRRVA